MMTCHNEEIGELLLFVFWANSVLMLREMHVAVLIVKLMVGALMEEKHMCSEK